MDEGSILTSTGSAAGIDLCLHIVRLRAVSVQDLARRAGMSERNSAQRRLETTNDSIDQIAEAVGMETAATLRLHFNRTLATTPTAYRRRFTTKC